MINYIDEFEDVVTSIFGVYLMSMQGFHLCVNDLKNRQDKDVLRMKNTRPELASIQYFNSRPFMFGKLTKGSLKKPEEVDLLYQCTQGEYKERNSEIGINSRFIGNMCVIAIYQYWEDYYRQKIAGFLHINNKNELTSNIMGDLRFLRRSIIHHRGVALKAVENCKILHWYKKGDDIFIDRNKMQDIVSEVKAYLQTLRKNVED
jgi:hypothetical protein